MPQVRPLRVRPVFLVGERSTFVRDDRLGFADTVDRSLQERKTDEILHALDYDFEEKVLIGADLDLRRLDTNVDGMVIFVHTMHKFPSLEQLAATGLPIILAGEEGAPGDALDAYEPIAGYENVAMAYAPDEILHRLSILKAAKWIDTAKICLFDRGERSLEARPWYNNPLVQEQLNVEYVDIGRFEKILSGISHEDADSLARSWLEASEAREPGPGDIAKSARLFLAMKQVIDEMHGDAAYVLWCGQFGGLVDGKMCLAIARLNDAGYLTGCWRGENMLPMMILHGLTERPVFFGEMHMLHDGVLSLRHCAVPTSMGVSTPVLRRWRDREGTVTAFCELPNDEVTVVHGGPGDKLVALRGRVIDTEDIGGDNCRTTVYVRLANAGTISGLCGREFAMAYGDHIRDVAEVGDLLGCSIA